MTELQDVQQVLPILETLTEGVLLVDQKSNIHYANKSCESLFGYFPGELTGQPLNLLLPRSIRPNHHKNVNEYHSSKQVPRHMSDRPILSAVRKNGDPLKVSVSLSNVVLDGVNYSAAVISNAQMIATSEANILRELAEKDALTGLVNRVFLSKTIQNHMDENGVFTMLFLDLNKFKPINDEFGHGMGDHILIQVAKRLCGHIRTGDCVARIGGDEFVLLIKNLDQCSRIRSLCEEIAHSISMPITCSGNTLNVGVSIGAAIFPIHGNDEKSILKAADTAMYQAKNTQQPYAIYSLDEAMTDG